MQLTGIHHLTAVSADAPANHAFYAGVLGMRLVKRTVNQDDVSAYHLFYGDGVASPGSDVTFFEWPVEPERRGTNAIIRTSLRVAGADTIRWWAAYFAEHGVKHQAPVERDGRLTLDFEDPEGQRLALVDDGGAGEAHAWDASSIPAERQIRGLGPIIASVPDLEPTELVLTHVLGMRRARSYRLGETGPEVHVFEMGEGGPAAEYHVAVEPGLPQARQGAGSVHHVAFRTPDATQYHAWVDRLKEMRIPNSGAVDRYYFESLYSVSYTHLDVYKRQVRCLSSAIFRHKGDYRSLIFDLGRVWRSVFTSVGWR